MGFRCYNKSQQVQDNKWHREWAQTWMTHSMSFGPRYVAFLLSFYIQLIFFHFRYYKSTKTISRYEKWWAEMGRMNNKGNGTRGIGPNLTACCNLTYLCLLVAYLQNIYTSFRFWPTYSDLCGLSWVVLYTSLLICWPELNVSQQ